MYKYIIIIYFITPQLSSFGQGQVNCSLLEVTEVIINNTNLTIDFNIFNADSMDTNYPYVAFTIDNNGDTIQHGNTNWFITFGLDTAWYHYTIPSAISPAYPLSIYFVYSDFMSIPATDDTCILSYNVISSTMHNSIDIDFQSFPNPTNEFITFTINSNFNYQIHLYDIYGKKIYSEQFNSKGIVMNLKRLYSNGIYFAKVLDPKGDVVATRKIICQ
jgi:hypothetical protein